MSLLLLGLSPGLDGLASLETIIRDALRLRAKRKQTNTLYLWYLGNLVDPILVGELNLVMSARGVSLKYDTNWLRNGFPLSEDHPLLDLVQRSVSAS